MNGTLSRDGRSVSTVHDRSRPTTAAITIENAAKHTSRHHQSRSQRHSVAVAHTQNIGSSGSSPPSARETFLNYFFGQNGPGPIAGSNLERPHGQQHVPIGRDTSMSETSLNRGLMAGKNNLDGNNAAFDMKSLGKHIEAVRL